MGIKEIFQQGWKELRRKSALLQAKRELKQKEKVYEEQLTALGQKAWEGKLDIDAYENVKELLTSAQKQQDDLKAQLEDLENRKKETEEKKKQENETFDSQLKEVEEKKKGIDDRLEDEKKVLKEAQKEMDNAKKRLAEITGEKDRLNKKADDADTPEEEKKQIPGKLEALDKEKAELDETVNTRTEEINGLLDAIKPIQEESDQFQKQINDIRARQKQVIGELDKAISEIRKEMDGNKDKLKEVDEEQEKNFKLLGEKLAAAGVTDEVVAAEMAAVQATEKEMAGIDTEIETLEQQGSAAAKSAFWQMIGIVAAGIVLLIIIIVLLSMLFKSCDKDKTADTRDDTTTAAVSESVKEKEKKTDKTAPQTMEDFTGIIKKQSEKIQGEDIVVSDKEAFTAALPNIRGWEMKPPSYGKQTFGQMETSQLTTTYTGPDAKEIEVTLIDTATASAVLQPWKIVFSLNRTVEDEDGYEKITTYKGMTVHEKYETRNNRARFTFIVKNRYLVHLDSRGDNSVKLLKDFITKFDLSKLQ
jgi:myosin heavy subunit